MHCCWAHFRASSEAPVAPVIPSTFYFYFFMCCYCSADGLMAAPISLGYLPLHFSARQGFFFFERCSNFIPAIRINTHCLLSRNSVHTPFRESNDFLDGILRSLYFFERDWNAILFERVESCISLLLLFCSSTCKHFYLVNCNFWKVEFTSFSDKYFFDVFQAPFVMIFSGNARYFR